MRVGVLLNSASGSGRNRDLRRALERHLAPDQVVVSCAADRADTTCRVKDMVASGADIIVAVGGDGTVNVVANAIFGSSCSLGVIPAGTANDFAMGLALPSRLVDACRNILEGIPRRVDVVRVNGWYFVTTGGVGLPAEVLESVDRLRRANGAVRRTVRLLGSGIYPVCVTRCLFERARGPCSLSVTLDGQEHRLKAHALLVTKQRRVGRYMHIAPQASATDGLLHLFVLEDRGSTRKLAMSALQTLRRRAGCQAGVRLLTGRRLRMTSEKVVRFCADGEMGPRDSSFEIEIMPRALAVVCPS